MTLRHVTLAFLAGAVAVLAFHQVMLALLHAAQLTTAVPFRMQPTRPFAVPQVWSLTFWGGVWGIVLGTMFGSAHYGRRLLAGTLFGAIVPSLVAWFIVMPLKGQPAGGGWTGSSLMTALLVNGAWGFGTILLLELFESATARVRAHV
jgi:hypothetical protein